MTDIQMGLYIQAEAKVTHADGTVEEVAPAEVAAEVQSDEESE